MLTEKDFSQIQNYIIQMLPQLLRQQPEIATTIEGIIAHQFPKRDEFARMLDEVKLLREDMDRRFEAMALRFEAMDRHFEALRDEMNQRFEALREDINRRFELMDQKFEALREDIDRRFELMDQKFEALREDIDRRFELMDQKFEALREDIDRRFVAFAEEMDRRFEAQRKETEHHFEQVEQRLDEQHRDILELKRRMIKVESTVDRIDQKITKFDAWLKVISGNVGDEKGQALEQLFALGLSYGLKERDILPETIQLRQQFVDTDGLIYLKKGKFIEIDLIAENGKLTVFEVKASAVETDVAIFARKVKLVQLQNPEKQVHGIFISPGARDEVKQCCTEYDFELLD